MRLSLAEAQVAQAEAAAGLVRQHLDNARIEAPIQGTVVRRQVNWVAGCPGAALHHQDISALKIESSVDAASFGRLAKGRRPR